MEKMIPCPIKDQEVFQRVWQRVMAGRDGGPIEALPPDNMQGDLSCACLENLARCQGGPGAETPPAEPAPPVPETPPVEEPPAPAPDQPAPEPPQAPEGPDTLPEPDGPHHGCDMPSLWEPPADASERTARLRQQVMEALEGWQFYRHLARRTRGNGCRVLNSMAGEMHRCARKLSAAYFLLTGLRYWPSELLAAPAIPSYWGALRQRHQAEQRQETAFRMAADDWDDPDMLELYEELIESCRGRCRQLRALLEQGV